MAVTYTWTVTSMNVMQTPEPDFVVIANWRCSGVEGDDSEEMDGTALFPQPEAAGDSFTAYADLTEADVLAWVWTQQSKEGTEATIAGQIKSKKNPPATPQSEALPW